MNPRWAFPLELGAKGEKRENILRLYVGVWIGPLSEEQLAINLSEKKMLEKLAMRAIRGW